MRWYLMTCNWPDKTFEHSLVLQTFRSKLFLPLLGKFGYHALLTFEMILVVGTFDCLFDIKCYVKLLRTFIRQFHETTHARYSTLFWNMRLHWVIFGTSYKLEYTFRKFLKIGLVVLFQIWWDHAFYGDMNTALLSYIFCIISIFHILLFYKMFMTLTAELI